MSTQSNLEKWAEDNTPIDKKYNAKQYPVFVCHIMNMFDRRVRYCECEWLAPYGRVISADCEKHDKEG